MEWVDGGVFKGDGSVNRNIIRVKFLSFLFIRRSGGDRCGRLHCKPNKCVQSVKTELELIMRSKGDNGIQYNHSHLQHGTFWLPRTHYQHCLSYTLPQNTEVSHEYIFLPQTLGATCPESQK